MTGPLLTTSDLWTLLIVAIAALVVGGIGLIVYELCVAQPAPPDIPCRRCEGHGWTVSPGWSRVPYTNCARCGGTGVE